MTTNDLLDSLASVCVSLDTCNKYTRLCLHVTIVSCRPHTYGPAGRTASMMQSYLVLAPMLFLDLASTLTV